MHKSKLGGLIIDCENTAPQTAADFWGKALGLTQRQDGDPKYITFDPGSDGLDIEVQNVTHPSRVHIDIETNDIPAEIKRLQALGASVVSKVETWCVMQAPTGHRFCVVPIQTDNFEEDATVWD